MVVMYVGWKIIKRTRIVRLEEMDLETDVYHVSEEDLKEAEREKSARGRVERILRWIF